MSTDNDDCMKRGPRVSELLKSEPDRAQRSLLDFFISGLPPSERESVADMVLRLMPEEGRCATKKAVVIRAFGDLPPSQREIVFTSALDEFKRSSRISTTTILEIWLMVKLDMRSLEALTSFAEKLDS